MSLHGRDHRQLAVQRHLKDLDIGKFRLACLNGQQTFFGAAGSKITIVASKDHYLISRRLLNMREDLGDPFQERLGKHVLRLPVFHLYHHNAFRVSGGCDHF